MDRRGFIGRLFKGAAAVGVASVPVGCSMPVPAQELMRQEPPPQGAALPEPGGIDLVGVGPVAYLVSEAGGYYGPVPVVTREDWWIAEWECMMLAQPVTMVGVALIPASGLPARDIKFASKRVLMSGDAMTVTGRIE